MALKRLTAILPSLSNPNAAGKDTELPGKTSIPPPVVPQEAFPGYNQQLTDLNKKYYELQKKLKEAQAEEPAAKALLAHPYIFVPNLSGMGMGGLQVPLPAKDLKAAQDNVERLKLVIADYNHQIFTLEWQKYALAALSDPMSPIGTVEEALEKIPHTQVDITPELTSWLSDLVSKIPAHIQLPPFWNGTVAEQQQMVLDIALSAPKLETKSLTNLTVDEIAKSFMPYTAQMPAGMTGEQLNAILRGNDMTTPEQQQYKDWCKEQADAWAANDARQKLQMEGLISSSLYQPTPGELAKLALTQPIMGTMMLVDKYSQYVVRPFAASTIMGGQHLFGTSDDNDVIKYSKLQTLYHQYKEAGEDSWTAYNLAFENWGTSLKLGQFDIGKMLIEAAFDPTTYIGFGIASGIALKTSNGLTKIGMRRIGQSLLSTTRFVENGVNAMGDAFFMAGKEVVTFPIKGAFKLAGFGYKIPASLTMQSRHFAANTVDRLVQLIGNDPEFAISRAGLTGIDGMTTEELAETIARYFKSKGSNPTEAWSKQAQVVSQLKRFKYLEQADIEKLLDGTGLSVPDIDTLHLARINQEIDMLSSGALEAKLNQSRQLFGAERQVSNQTSKMTADKILDHLGFIGHTDEAAKIVKTNLDTAMKKVESDLLDVISGPANKVLAKLYTYLEDIEYSNLRNSISTRLISSGSTIGWISRTADNILYHPILLNMERKVILPFAKMQLVFPTFGPWNYLENLQRSWLGGGCLTYPKDFGGVEELQRFVGNVDGFPHELMLGPDSDMLSNLAVIDAKSGTGLESYGVMSKIPFITSDVKLFGKNLTISLPLPNGMNMRVGSGATYNKWWEKHNNTLTAASFMSFTKKAFTEVAPEPTKLILDTVNAHTSKLMSSGLNKGTANGILRQAQQEAFNNPNAISRMKDITVPVMERRDIAMKLQSTLSRCTEVDETTKRMWLNAELNGSLNPTNVDSFKKDLIHLRRDTTVGTLQLQSDRMHRMAEDFVRSQPDNIADFVADNRNISAMMEAFDERISTTIAIIEERRHNLPLSEQGEYVRKSMKNVMDFMSEGGTDFNRMFEHMRASAYDQPLDWSRVSWSPEKDDIIKSMGGTEIPDTPYHQFDWSKITWGEGITPELQKSIKNQLGNLYHIEGLDIRGFSIVKFTGAERPRAAWNDVTRHIEFDSPENITSLHHEIGHAVLQAYWDKGDTSIIREFSKVIKKDYSEIAKKSYFLSYLENRTSHEKFARDFSTWSTGTDNTIANEFSLEEIKFFQKYFPKDAPSKVKAREMIDRLPVNIKNRVKRIAYLGIEGAQAAYSPATQMIVFTNKSFLNEGSFYHELAHSHYSGLLNAGGNDAVHSAQRLSDFAGIMRNELEQLTAKGGTPIIFSDSLIDDIARTVNNTSYDKFYEVHESMSELFAAWVQDPIKFRKAGEIDLPVQTKSGWAPVNLSADTRQKLDLFFKEDFPLRNFKLPSMQTYEAMNNLKQSYISLIQSVRTENNKLYTLINSTSKKLRTNEFWNGPDGINTKIARNWDTFRKGSKTQIGADQLKDDIANATRRFTKSVDMDETFIPQSLPPVNPRGLSVSDICNLFGNTADSVYGGLTQQVADQAIIRPKKDFVRYVKLQANNYLTERKINKTLDELGFSDKAIEDVYNQMWRSQGIEPAALQPDSPFVMQMNEIAAETSRLYGTVQWDEKTVKNMQNYFDAVATDLKKLPMYKELPKIDIEEYHGVDALTLITDMKLGSDARAYKISMPGRADMFNIAADSKYVYVSDLLALRKEFGYTAQALRRLSEFAHGRPIITGGLTDEGYKMMKTLEKAGYVTLSPPPEGMFKESDFISDTLPDWDTFVQGLHAPYTVTVHPEKFPTRTLSGNMGNELWQATKEQVMSRAKELHYLAFPNCSNDNIIDETMRNIFPFWNYELFRWRWLPRTFMRTPGTFTNTGRFMDYSDGGYISMPFTDLQYGPFRSTIWSGLSSLWKKDFPEYQDAIPGAEMIGTASRIGFYPNVLATSIMALFGSSQDRAELEGLLPPFARGGLSTLRALSPDHIGKALDTLFPDRFRAYLTMVTLGSLGYDADSIYRKKKLQQATTPEEDKLWQKAESHVDGWIGLLMSQAGFFRMRPQEYINFRQEMMLAIEESTGISVKEQTDIDRLYPVTGKRLSDYYHFDILQQKLLYEAENFRNWQGVTAPLSPSSMQNMEAKVKDYYEDLEKIHKEARYTGVFDADGKLLAPSIMDIESQWHAGIVGPDQWTSTGGSILSKAAEASRVLGKSKAYADVPKTLEERTESLLKQGKPVPTLGPDQELLYMFYDLKPILVTNPDTGRQEYDFDTYYAYVDALLESLQPSYRDRLLERIQLDWTPMEKLYWQASRDHLRPYRQVRSIVEATYSPEELAIIDRYSVASIPERQAIQDIDKDGSGLISGFNKKVEDARKRLRILNPETDAYLAFFGITQSFMTKKGEEAYNSLRKQYEMR